MSILKKTPIYQEHITLGATMVEFGGWEMPVQYQSILEEHRHTRESVSIFDICHMGEFIIEGDKSTDELERLFTMSVADIPIKTCRYGMMLNDKGGIIDDLIVFRIEEKKWMIVVNSATTEKDAAHIRNNLNKDVNFIDISSKIGKVDIQGPLSRDILKHFVANIDKLDYYTFDYFNLLGENVIISRTGYTGELGYEIYYLWEKTKDLWKELLRNDKVKPAGLGARDILRLEMGYSLYGHELSEDVSPLEASLSRFIDFEKEFIGKESLIKGSVVKRKLMGIVSSTRRSPRAGQKIFSRLGKEIGLITSGSFSPCLNLGIGLGFIVPNKYKKNDEILFGDENKQSKGMISERIFFKQGTLKN